MMIIPALVNLNAGVYNVCSYKKIHEVFSWIFLFS